MRERHIYDYRVEPQSAADKVAHMVGRDKRVLELGPGPGAITRLLHENQCRITALELDPSAIAIVKPYCEKIYTSNLDDADWTSILADEKFHVIVAADVLEHLRDPWRTLKSLHSYLSEDGFVVVSLPHLGHCTVLACLLQGEFEYQPWGLLDRTHIRFFGVKSVQRLFEGAGFKILEAEFVVKEPNQTEFAREWRKLPKETQDILAEAPFAGIYQVVVKAAPIASKGKALQLAFLPVPSAPITSTGMRSSRLYRYMLSFIGLETRRKISQVLQRFGRRS